MANPQWGSGHATHDERPAQGQDASINPAAALRNAATGQYFLQAVRFNIPAVLMRAWVPASMPGATAFLAGYRLVDY